VSRRHSCLLTFNPVSAKCCKQTFFRIAWTRVLAHSQPGWPDWANFASVLGDFLPSYWAKFCLHIGPIFDFILGQFSPPFWANFRLQIGRLVSLANFIITKVAQLFHGKQVCILFWHKMYWVTYLATFSRTHLVTLPYKHSDDNFLLIFWKKNFFGRWRRFAGENKLKRTKDPWYPWKQKLYQSLMHLHCIKGKSPCYIVAII
jgi:hypothetical protein